MGFLYRRIGLYLVASILLAVVPLLVIAGVLVVRQQSLQRDPNDVYMQQMLMNAYEQKQMLYQLAADNGDR